MNDNKSKSYSSWWHLQEKITNNSNISNNSENETQQRRPEEHQHQHQHQQCNLKYWFNHAYTWLFTWAFFTISCITNVTSTVVRTIGVDTLRFQITIVAGRFRTFIDVWNGKDCQSFRKLINRACCLFSILSTFYSVRTFHTCTIVSITMITAETFTVVRNNGLHTSCIYMTWVYALRTLVCA